MLALVIEDAMLSLGAHRNQTAAAPSFIRRGDWRVMSCAMNPSLTTSKPEQGRRIPR